jgi:hypothetical protein
LAHGRVTPPSGRDRARCDGIGWLPSRRTSRVPLTSGRPPFPPPHAVRPAIVGSKSGRPPDSWSSVALQYSPRHREGYESTHTGGSHDWATVGGCYPGPTCRVLWQLTHQPVFRRRIGWGLHWR